MQAAAAATKHSFVPCNYTKKQQLLSSSQACLATHSSRASSAPPPRCQRPPASLQLSRFANCSRLRQSLSPIAFAVCARRFPGTRERRRFPAVRRAVRGPSNCASTRQSGSSRPQHTEPLPERSSSQAKTFCRIVPELNGFPCHHWMPGSWRRTLTSATSVQCHRRRSVSCRPVSKRYR